MRTIGSIYADYQIPKPLQLHMLRVAAVASQICDSFNGNLNKEDVVTIALLHDMGNIIKVNFSRFPEFWQEEGVEYWQSVKDSFIDKYGDNEDSATLQIMHELGIEDSLKQVASNMSFSLICKIAGEDNFNLKICKYADLRVAPYGVLSYKDRLEEGLARYKNHPSAVEGEDLSRLTGCGYEVEKQIFSKCKIKPEDINDESVAPIIEELKKFVIK